MKPLLLSAIAKLSVPLVFLVLSLASLSNNSFAAEDQDCYTCHDDVTLTMKKDGKTKSIYVKEGTLAGTVHEDNGCVSCHVDADVEEFPHSSPLPAVDCSMCHDDIAETFASSSHGKALARGDKDAPTCVDCHGKHKIYSHLDPKSPTYIMNIPKTCGACHRESSAVAKRHAIPQKDILKNYSMSIHGEGLLRAGLTVTAVCTSCHTAHNALPHTDPNSSISEANLAGTCMQCHSQIERVHQKVIKGEMWEKQPGVIPTCADCHAPHEIRRAIYTLEFTNQYCLGCHSDHELTRVLTDGSIDSLYIDASTIENSAHGININCVKCHSNVNPRKNPVCKDSGPVDCAGCHAEAGVNYTKGIHGTLQKEGDQNAPTCTDCHGGHNVYENSNPASPTFTRNIPTLCANCHRSGEKAAARLQGLGGHIVKHYSMSIHGKGLYESGLMVSAVCSDCHNAHLILPPTNPKSSVYHNNVGDTCGKCHLGIEEQFNKSIHSPLVSKTNKRLPSCNNCHSSHEIERVDRGDFRAQMLKQCGGCHEEETKSYFQTYHGKVSKLGSVVAAKCSDCHGSHNILPPSFTASTLSHENVVETCKQCHPNSNRKFAGYLTHATHHDKSKYPYLYYTFWAMTWLVIGVFVFFGIHTLLWIPRSIRERKKLNAREKSKSNRYMKRFTSFPRIIHLLVIFSFFLLALTGMGLKFSGSPWALKLISFFGGVASAGIIHRIGALVTFTYFTLHFIMIFRNAKKRKQGILRFMFNKEGLVPNGRDFVEFWQTIKWFFGAGEAPKYGRWTYWEKFDYLAVFWGVALIGSTGLVLWFPEFWTRLIPGYLINIATIIHSDEALLATGFIFTIHFFNTHFRPQKFPMDQVIFTGRIEEEEWKHERPREYELLKAEGRLEEVLTDEPPKRWVVIWSRIIGFTLLTTGFLLVAAIIWAMLTQYK